jgi:hypothetical protein
VVPAAKCASARRPRACGGSTHTWRRAAAEPLTLERAAAEFVVSFGSHDIDDEARGKVKALIKDQLEASQLSWPKQIRTFVDPRPSTLVAESDKVVAVDAAYACALGTASASPPGRQRQWDLRAGFAPTKRSD